jgi:hypothetical protein
VQRSIRRLRGVNVVEPVFDGHRETARYYDRRLTQL